MTFYLQKIKHLRTEILYIKQRVNYLKQKAIAIQEFKVEGQALRHRQLDFEEDLIAKK